MAGKTKKKKPQPKCPKCGMPFDGVKGHICQYCKSCSG